MKLDLGRMKQIIIFSDQLSTNKTRDSWFSIQNSLPCYDSLFKHLYVIPRFRAVGMLKARFFSKKQAKILGKSCHQNKISRVWVRMWFVLCSIDVCVRQLQNSKGLCELNNKTHQDITDDDKDKALNSTISSKLN